MEPNKKMILTRVKGKANLNCKKPWEYHTVKKPQGYLFGKTYIIYPVGFSGLRICKIHGDANFCPPKTMQEKEFSRNSSMTSANVVSGGHVTTLRDMQSATHKSSIVRTSESYYA